MSSRVILPQSGSAPPTSIHAAPDSAAALMASSLSAQQQEANMDFIYHQTIIPTQKITHCVEGTFTVPGAIDFVVVRNDTLELWTLHVDRNIAECVHATRLFSRIYQIAAVPTVAAARSVSSGSNGSGSGGRGILDSSGSADSTAAVQRIAVTSETGYLVLLRYDLDHPPAPARLLQDPTASLDNNNDNDNDKNDNIHHGLGTPSITSLRGQFVRVSEVSLGRSGARLTAPGARLAVDPLGRAVLVTALMRLKVIVPLRRRDDYKPDLSQRRGNGLKGKEDMEDEEDPIAGISSGIGMGPAKRRLVARDVISFASPVEAHRQTLIFSVCALDGATENATFATLEQEIREVSESQAQQSNVKSGTAFLRHAPGSGSGSGGKQLVVYAFVSGLQQVQRTHLVSVPATAHRIVAVPAAPFGPGGVLLCTDTEIIWYDLLPQLHGRSILGQSYESNTRDTDAAGMGAPLLPGLSALSLYKTAAPFPRRDDFRDQLYDPMIIAHASTCVRNDFFMLLQDDQGDVFRVVLTIQDVQRSYDALRTIQTQSHTQQQQAASVSVPSPLTISYFDTIPPTSALVLFRRGFVFAASESAVTHGLYKIVKDGYRSDKEYILSRMRMVERGNTSTRPKSAEVDDVEDAETLGKEKPVSESMGPPTLRPMRPPAANSSRVVPLFLPHTKLQHMVLLESYPNTPPVLSFVTHIHGNDKSDQTSSLREQQQQQPEQQQQQQQQQVQVDAVVGRGSDSAILHARYGYAARLESTFTLPAVFTFLRPLCSAMAMRQRWFEMQQDATVASQRFARPRRRRVAGPLWDDKLLLSTRQGTTILSLTITGQVEPDTLSGFVTSEHTIAAGALRRGVGYAQVTPSCILILPHTPSADTPSMPIAEGMTWTHPHGKRMLAAAVSSTTIIVSFTQGGGIASFDMGPSGTRLQQLDMVPTFPHVPAISLLYDPDGEDNNVGTMSMMSMSRGAATAGLAAIATVSHEVFIVNPKKLREPFETIYCANQDNAHSNNPVGHHNINIHSSHNNNSGGSNASPIASVLLTYLGRTDVARRLFCFIGHMDGTVTRCELDTATCKVMDRAVLTCGVLPCQMIAGDGERVCYILSGDLNWRCDVRDGLAKTVPWRFPSPQTMYAAFRRPPPASNTSGKNTTATTTTTTSATVAEEMVLGVAGNTLSLFSAKQNGGGGAADAAALEYSFAHTPLTVAGRRVLQHPTRPECVIVIGTEHRGYGVAAIRRAAGAGASNAAVSGIVSAATDHSRLSETAASPRRGIPLDKPQRSLNHRNHYASTLQLYNRYTDRLDPPVYFPEGEAVLSATVGSFVKDFGKEPIVVVGCAEQFTHGSGCGTSPSWLQGRLRAYRFAVAPAVPGVPPSMRLEQLHDTLLASEGPDVARDYPSALHICSEVGLLFVGMGKESGLHVYGWGQRRFLRKRRLPNVPGRITSIETVFIPPPGHSSSSSLSLASGMPTGTMSSGSGGGSGSSYAADLFRCLPNSIAREHRLLILCGTLDQSVFLATVQPAGGSAAAMSFLMIIARDAIPRAVTSVACLDARTYAVADRFGTVAFLRLPKTARLGFAEPLQHMTDAEIVEAEAFAKNEQLLDEVAVHNTGQLVTCMRVQEYDPSAGTDPSLAIRILFYATTLGAIGAYTPFVREEDAVLAAHLQPLLATHFRCLLYGSRGHLPYTVSGRLTASPAVSPVHHIFEGDLAHLLLKASTAIFSTEAKAHIEAELQRLERTEGAQRKVLGLPHRIWPALSELVAKQRALVTLPP